MGRFQAKNRVIQAAAAVLALFALPALASSTTRAPASQTGQQTQPQSEGTALAQADAFSTAGEQAAFVGAYQMYFGPYGRITNEEDRNKLIRETAASIDDCINGRDCGADKQEKVLKALMQFNMGQDVKRMMLTNNTNKEAMRSIDNSADAMTRAKGQGVLSQSEIEQALGRGRDVTVDTADKVKPYQTAKTTNLSRSTGPTKEPYYQLNEAEVTHKIDDTYLREREILGEKFLKDYSAFLDDFSAADDRISKRFYKYVPTKADGKIYVYEGKGSVINCYKDEKWCRENGSLALNQERMSEVQIEQQNKKVREMIATYKQNLKPIQGFRGEDGKAHITGEGSNPQDLGFGEMAEIDPAQFPEINFSDLMENGKISAANRSRAVARVVNAQFKRAADEADKEKAKDRKIASAGEKNPNWIHNITLSPQSFDQFLDEIWPSAAGRQKILSSAPPVQEPQKPAEEQADDLANRDRYGRPLDGVRPTDHRRPRQ